MSRPALKRRATLGGHLPGDTDCTVTVNVICATGLAAKHSDKKTSNPYALIRLGNTERRTKTVYKSLNPSWDEEFEFHGVSAQHALLRVALYDAQIDLADDHFLGECIVPIASIEEVSSE